MAKRLDIGPTARTQLIALAHSWRQGEHVLITGGTGSGKTLLARQLDEIRIQAGGYVVVFVCKLKPDATLTTYYPASDGWVRWKEWKDKPRIDEQKVLLWPAVEGKDERAAAALMRRVFAEAISGIFKTGKWTVHIDEGLFFTSPAYLNFGRELGMLYALMRSSKGTVITLAQRPSHLPLALYANIDHAFVGRTSEPVDLKRLANMDSVTSSKEIAREISGYGKHDFMWIRLGTDKPPQRVNLAE